MKNFFFLLLGALSLCASYNTSLEIHHPAHDYPLLISNDCQNWVNLKTESYAGYDYASADLSLSSGQNIYLGIASIFKKSFALNWYTKILRPASTIFKTWLEPRTTRFFDVKIISGQEDPSEGPNVIEKDSSRKTFLKFKLNADNDKDGLPDDIEFEKYNALPGLADSDGDGLTDGVEALQKKTNPLLWDTDGDGISDAEDPDPLTPNFRLSEAAWVAHWSNVYQRLNLDAAAWNVKGDFAKNIYPFFKKGQRKVLLEPSTIYRHVGKIETNFFEMTMLAPCAVTGAVYWADGNFFVEKTQFLPIATPPGVEIETPAQFFLARYGLPIRIGLITDTPLEGVSREEEINFWSTDGPLSETLKVVLLDENGHTPTNALPRKPILISPASQAECISNVNFTFQSETKINLLNIFTEEKEISVSLTNQFAFAFTPPSEGLVVWSVDAVSTNGCAASSEMRYFYFYREESSLDSDHDGFPDREEIKRGSDPDDASDFPPSAASSNAVLKAESNVYFSYEISGSGAFLPLRYETTSVLPRGIFLDKTGRLYGVPETLGTYQITVSIYDQKNRKAETTLDLSVTKNTAGTLKLGGGKLQ